MKHHTIVALTAVLFAGTACAGGMRDTSSGSSGQGATGAGTMTPPAVSAGANTSSIPAFETLDANNDGVITSNEVGRSSSSRISAEQFKRFDKDLDGNLTRAEYDSAGGVSPTDRGGTESGNSSDGTTGSGAGGAGTTP